MQVEVVVDQFNAIIQSHDRLIARYAIVDGKSESIVVHDAVIVVVFPSVPPVGVFVEIGLISYTRNVCLGWNIHHVNKRCIFPKHAKYENNQSQVFTSQLWAWPNCIYTVQRVFSLRWLNRYLRRYQKVVIE